jgi:hypothetical protein
MRMTAHATGELACLSHLQCDQLLNGELPDRHDLHDHAATCARCAARLAAHRQERAAFDVARPVLRRRRSRWPAVGAAAAAAAVVAVWLVAAREPAAPATRAKGKPAIGFYVKHGDAVRLGGADEILYPRDAINFTASTEAPAFLAIISVDGAGQVSVYYPDRPTAAPVAVGRDQLLPRSVVLDDVVGRERLVAVFCAQSIAVAALAQAVGNAAALPDGCVADTVMVDKRRAP